MNKNNNYIVFAIICLQFIGVYASSHTHTDEFLVGTSNGFQQIVQHSDADNCKHLPLSHEKDCALCLIFSHQSFKHTAFVYAINNEKIGTIVDSKHFILPNFLLSHSISRRGPPAVIA